MRNIYLGILSITYSIIILIFIFMGKLGSFIAPNMHIYIYLGIVFLITVGVGLIISKEKGRIKISDLFLLLPILTLLFIGDGRLNTSLVSNRNNMFKNKNNTTKKIKYESYTTSDIDYSNIDFTNVDFDVADDTYATLADMITFHPNPDKFIGKTIRVKGFSLIDDKYIPKGSFAIGKYLVSCCVADSSFSGFFVNIDDISKIKNNKWYELEGVFELGQDINGETIVYIHAVNIKEISSKGEEYYIYPCFNYGDGSCKQMLKYDLQ